MTSDAHQGQPAPVLREELAASKIKLEQPFRSTLMLVCVDHIIFDTQWVY